MATLKLHDTMTRQPQPVSAVDGKALRFYCCGPTVYGPAHIGNFRTFLVQDFFRRVVELGGLKTKHVRNLTDVDDKTIRESQAQGQTLTDFTTHWTERFHADAKALNMLEPHVEPSAVGHIDEQVALTEKLVEKGHAYQSEDGSVYFSISSYEPYGRLSRLDRRELKSGAGETANDADEYEKDNISDFALWKARKSGDGDNFWPSPWGEGRPGWHLECSAMAMKYLGNSFDLHSGGVDLCFPHHENEIAQSEAATGENFSRLWFHVEHLMVDGAKMSKSLGNLYALSDIEAKGSNAAELRYALLAGHYKSKLNFSLDRLTEARGNLQRIANIAGALADRAGKPGLASYDELQRRAHKGSGVEFGPFVGAWAALNDDLNSPKALGEMFSTLKPLEKGVADGSLSQEDAAAALEGLGGIVAAFGWLLPDPEPAESEIEVPGNIAELAERRWQAKQSKDWSEADRFRDELAEKGWQVKDGKEGYSV
ncbi:MAG: cysteine--tRNA ligase, partial [Verrucomicrobiota bacterium]